MKYLVAEKLSDQFTRSKAGIQKESARSSAVTITNQIIQVFAQAAGLVVLARLVQPEEFGLFAMSATLTGIARLFIDFGLTDATVQGKNINNNILSALFYANILLGILVFFVCLLLSGPISRLYSAPQLREIIWVSSVSIPIIAFSLQHRAIMARQMRFVELSVISTSGLLLGVMAAIFTAAVWSWGVWSLVTQVLVSAVFTTSASLYATKWMPSIKVRVREARDRLKFGAYMTGFGVANYFQNQFDQVAIGAKVGAESLGYYNRAYTLFMLPITTLVWAAGGVLVSALSRLADSPKEWKKLYLDSLQLLCLPTGLIAIGMFCFPDRVVSILLGDQWTSSAEILRYLALGMFVMPAYYSSGWIFISLGKAKQKFYGAVLAAFIYVAFVLYGLRFGSVGVALAFVAAVYVITPVWVWWASAGSGLNVAEVLYRCAPSWLGAISSYTAYAFLYDADVEHSLFSDLLWGGAISSIYLTTFFCFVFILPGMNKVLLQNKIGSRGGPVA